MLGASIPTASRRRESSRAALVWPPPIRAVTISTLVRVPMSVIAVVRCGLRTHAPNAPRFGPVVAQRRAPSRTAVTAAVLNSRVDVLGTSIGAFITSWQPYALAVAALTRTLLAQRAFQTRRLSASMPVLAVVEPLPGAPVGSSVFSEWAMLVRVACDNTSSKAASR